MTKHIANIFTACRMLGSAALLFFPAFSPAFYGIYLLCGLSDMADGAIARKTNSVSEFGSKLDTAADLAFTAAACIKLLPVLPIPRWLWIWSGAIAAIKISSLLRGYLANKQFLALHTRMNKATGLLLFLLPLTLSFMELKYSAVAVCSLATLSAIQEGAYAAAGFKGA